MSTVLKVILIILIIIAALMVVMYILGNVQKRSQNLKELLWKRRHRQCRFMSSTRSE